MTQEEKQLLLKDLCARLTYDVKCSALLKQIDGSFKSVFGTLKGYNGWAIVGNNLVDIETVRPYLRPMLSMTEEEKHELYNIRPYFINSDNIVSGTQCNTFIQASECQDWLNAHHFDYRGLIEKGLALEAKEGMHE